MESVRERNPIKLMKLLHLRCTAKHTLNYIHFIFIERGTTAPFSGQGEARETMHANFALI